MADREYETIEPGKEGKRYKGDEREADRLAGPDSVAGRVRETRRRRDPCNNPELAGLPMCKKHSANPVEPSRGPREDIYGPRDQ